MTSPAQIATRSTGPKTAPSKLAVSHNAQARCLNLVLGAADSILAQSLTGKKGDPLAKIERYTASAAVPSQTAVPSRLTSPETAIQPSEG